MRTPHFHQLHQIDSVALAAEAALGLVAMPARVSPKFFYDALGSRLFDAITELAEYYPTRTESAILDEQAGELAASVQGLLGQGATLIDLGAGNCVKAARLFDTLGIARYVAVDISVDFLRQSIDCLQRQYPDVEMVGVGLDFSSRLVLPAGLCDGPSLVFYPGSSIGNFNPDEALRLLQEARALAQGGALLIGVDLHKAAAPLEAAYDDDLGVTAAFNLNLLKHLNQLLGSDFDVRQWQHRALFNEAQSRIEMHLESRVDQCVRWPGAERRFGAGERMHTENSYKWRPKDFEALLHDAGFGRVQTWTDEKNWFALMLAQAS